MVMGNIIANWTQLFRKRFTDEENQKVVRPLCDDSESVCPS